MSLDINNFNKIQQTEAPDTCNQHENTDETETELSLLKQSFPMIKSDCTGEILTPGSVLYEMIMLFAAKGVHPEHMQGAIIIVLGFISARLGSPLAIFVTADEESLASEILSACREIVPESAYLSFWEMDKRALFRGGSHFKYKAILGFDLKGFKGNVDAILRIIEQGLLVTQQSFKKHDIAGIEETKVEGPIGFITIVKDGPVDFPYALRVHFSTSPGIKRNALIQQARPKNAELLKKIKQDTAKFKKQLERLSNEPVVLDFLLEAIAESCDVNVPNVKASFKNMLRLLSIIIRLNRAKPFNVGEIMAEYFNVAKDSLDIPVAGNYEKCLPLGSQHAGNDQQGAGVGAIGTKVDYYYFKLLAENLMPTGAESLTPRQQQVYAGIRQFNVGYIQNCLTLDDPNDEAEIMQMLFLFPDNIRAWVDREAALKVVRDDGGEPMSLATLNIELQHLVEKKVVARNKSPKHKNKYLYAVTDLHFGNTSRLPAPSTIIDPVYNGAQVTVQNPFTGEMETI